MDKSCYRVIDHEWRRDKGLRLCLMELRGKAWEWNVLPTHTHMVGWLPFHDGRAFSYRPHGSLGEARTAYDARVANFPFLHDHARFNEIDRLDWCVGGGAVADYQRARVYAWERAVLGRARSREEIHIDEATKLIAELLAGLGSYQARSVSRARANAKASTANGFGEINLVTTRSGYVRTATAIHEAAHVATTRATPGHGPVFVTVVAEAYGRVMGLDVDAALHEAVLRGVHAAPRAWLADMIEGPTAVARSSLESAA